MSKYEATIADRIWNRALLEDVSDLRDGDRALAAMALTDAYVMGGDVMQTVEILDNDGTLEEAAEAFRYFGRPDVADLLIEARAYYLTDEYRADDEYFDKRYRALLPDDSAELIPRFEAILRSKPSAFAPLLNQ